MLQRVSSVFVRFSYEYQLSITEINLLENVRAKLSRQSFFFPPDFCKVYVTGSWYSFCLIYLCNINHCKKCSVFLVENKQEKRKKQIVALMMALKKKCRRR